MSLTDFYPPLSPIGSVGVCSSVANGGDINLFIGKEAKRAFIREMRSGLAENCFIEHLVGGTAKNCVVGRMTGGTLEDSDCGWVAKGIVIKDNTHSNFGVILGSLVQSFSMDERFMEKVKEREAWRQEMKRTGQNFKRIRAVGIGELMAKWESGWPLD